MDDYEHRNDFASDAEAAAPSEPRPAVRSAALVPAPVGGGARAAASPARQAPQAEPLPKAAGAGSTGPPTTLLGLIASSRAAQGGPAVLRDSCGGRRLQGPRPEFVFLTEDCRPDSLEARRHAAANIHACLDAAWEDSTRTRYDAALRGMVSSLESSTQVALLPCDTDDKLMLLFSGLLRRPWGTVSTTKAAVRAWHVERDILCSFEAAWTTRAWHFWRGLKKLADHSLRRAKRPLSLAEVTGVQRCRLAQGSVAGLRDAAMIALAFFGIRRFAELQALLLADVVVEESAVQIRIRKQKNDPFGEGLLIWVPELPPLGPFCPAKLLRAWRQQRAEVHGQAGGVFFCVTGAVEPRPVSADTFRRMLSRHLKDAQVGSHSLRKGGAQWWKHSASLPEELVQGQGGWSSIDVMRNFYTKFSASARKQRLLEAACAACTAIAAPAGLPPNPGELPVWRRPL